MLALGAVSHKLAKEGNILRAKRTTQWAHSLLGIHGRCAKYCIVIVLLVKYGYQNG